MEFLLIIFVGFVLLQIAMSAFVDVSTSKPRTLEPTSGDKAEKWMGDLQSLCEYTDELLHEELKRNCARQQRINRKPTDLTSYNDPTVGGV